MADHRSRPIVSRHVAVIGAGASGLAAARELTREGHRVVVFEREDQIGGTWVYTSRVESDPIGLDPNRSIVHSSMYDSLRTNLPREVMGFRDFPFVPRDNNNDNHNEFRDCRRFPSHREVLMYLKDFSMEFGIEKLVRFETEVVNVSLVDKTSHQWRVLSKKKKKKYDDLVDEVFDAVVVCNGHNSEPRTAEIPGIDVWPGKQIHSHNYRTPHPFRDQVVVLIGIAQSAIDISRDISGVVKEAHIAARSNSNPQIAKLPGSDNIWLHPLIKSVHKDGRVVFEDNSFVFADTILHCTGYKFNFPFLKIDGVISVDENRVGPLYKHVFPPALAPWLSFVGIPLKSLPLPMFELQSKWISGVLSNRIDIPSDEEMNEDIAAFYSTLELENVPKRHTHIITRRLFEYEDWLADQCGCAAYEDWRKEAYFRLVRRFAAQSATYRDDNDDEDLFSMANRDFQKNLPNGDLFTVSIKEPRNSRL